MGGDVVHCDIHLRGLAVVVAWNDHDHHMRHTELDIDLHLDTANNQALFTLGRSVLGQDLRRPINLFLFIYPESIESLEFEADVRLPTSAILDHQPPAILDHQPHQRFGCLRFVTSRSLDFIGPQDPPLEEFRDVFHTMNALSLVLNFNIYFNMSPIQPELLRQISSFPSLFSPTNRRLETDVRRADLRTLYGGLGGRRINTVLSPASSALPGNGTEEEVTTAEKAANVGLQRPAHTSTPPGRKRQSR
ncbi:hypothetical protein B0T20DRAFT_165848 [Sordaria brevicollis]|uniref:Uncharacterized protein n=1 Tax=Sordaria brevicollis TaxID=83679 RepID=A0AAE0PGJ8_SORBR|nr:hypothetical protein B0T20DRAFT_165848 [Sordaria brevicollis]